MNCIHRIGICIFMGRMWFLLLTFWFQKVFAKSSKASVSHVWVPQILMQSMQDPAEVEGWKLIGQMVDTLWEDGTVIYFHSPGGGGTYPKAKVLEWRGEVQSKQHIKEMARCDFWRGVAADDYSNTAWLRVASFMRARNCINATDHNKAQYMEALTGAVYALATHNQFMINCFIEIQPSSKAALATEIWFELEKLGMKASNTTRERARQAIRAARRQKCLDEWPALAPRLTSPDMPHQSTSPTETERAEYIDQVGSHSLPNVRQEVDDLLNMLKNSSNDAVAIQAVDSSVAQAVVQDHDISNAALPAQPVALAAAVDAYTCDLCDLTGQWFNKCRECDKWTCRLHTFWCTRCPKGRDKYMICKECNDTGNFLRRSNKIWTCQMCQSSQQ